MDDIQIIELFQKRNEDAIKESRTKYGRYCASIAGNILHSAEDTEECVNDTWLRAWNSIPPEKPKRLAVFLGRIARNLAIDRYRKNTAAKNGGGQTALCLDELSECIGEESAIEDRLALKEIIQKFLTGLPERNREIFLLRYWYMMPTTEVAKNRGMTEGAVKMMLKRDRDKLKDVLMKEGVGI